MLLLWRLSGASLAPPGRLVGLRQSGAILMPRLQVKGACSQGRRVALVGAAPQ
jgi:hypothetical protein